MTFEAYKKEIIEQTEGTPIIERRLGED